MNYEHQMVDLEVSTSQSVSLRKVKSDNAVYIINTDSRLNVTVMKSTFSCNSKGAMQVYSEFENSFLQQVQITDSVFQDNGKGPNKYDPNKNILSTRYAALTINKTQFIRNIASEMGIAVAFQSSVVLAHNSFHTNKGSPALFLYRSNTNIGNCQFVNNSGNTAIVMQFECDEPESVITDSLFQENNNTAFDETTGGALYIEGSAS